MSSHSTANRFHGALLFVSIIILIVIALMSVNIYLGKQIPEQTIAANITSQQLQTVEQLRRSLRSIDAETITNESRSEITRQIQVSLSKIDQTLVALNQGGMLRGPLGKPLDIPAITSNESIGLLEDTQKHWNPTKEALVHILFALNKTGPLNNAFTGTQKRVRERSNLLSDSLGELAESLEMDVKRKTDFTTILSYAGIALGILTIGLFIFFFSPRLRKLDEDRTIEGNRLKLLFKDLHEAVVVVDRQQRVAGEYSRSACNLFATEQITGKHLYELLRPYVSPEDINNINQHIAFLFNTAGLDSSESNSSITVSTLKSDDGTNSELTLHFKPINQEETATRVLVSIGKTTLEPIETNNEPDTPLELTELVSSLGALTQENPAYIKNFFNDAESAISTIYRVINTFLGQTNAPKGSLEAANKVISDEIVRLKNISTTMHFDAFSQPIRNLENELKQLTEHSKVSQFNFQPALANLDKLSTLTQLINLYREHSAPTPQPLFEHLKPYATEIASRENKQVTTVLTGLQEHALASDTQSLIDTISKQFIQHSLIHSIEPPETRTLNNKSPVARIDVTLNRLNEGELELNVRDDGAGIDFEKIKEIALQRDIAPSSQLKHWSNRKLFNLTLLPYFWSSLEQDEFEEQQIGMEETLHQIKDSGGDIQVSTRPGRYTLYQITLPITTTLDTQQSRVNNTRSSVS